MKIEEMKEEDRARLEAAVKGAASRKGFDPDGYWRRYVRQSGKDHKLKVSEYQKLILDEMHRRGWDVPACLDYEASPVSKEKDRIIDGWESYSEFKVIYGSNEGIYIDWVLVSPNGDREGGKRREYLSCFKTQGTSLTYAEEMGLLAGRLTWLAREIVV